MRTFFTLLLILINSSVLADEKASFCGDATEDMKILGVFPIIKAGNFKDFIDSNQNSRASAVKSFADISTKLLSIEETPIKPDQIKNLLLFFSDFHDYMVSASDKGIGLALSDLTLSEIEALYARTSVSHRKIQFYQSDNPQDIDFAIYGRYSFINQDQVLLTVIVTKLSTKEQRSFSATGPITLAAKKVALQIFQSFQMPKVARFDNPLEGRELIAPPSFNGSSLVDIDSAVALCKSQDARIIQHNELAYVKLMGSFYTGLPIDPSGYYYFTDNNQLNIGHLSSGEHYPIDSTSVRRANLICVRDN